MNSMRVLWKGFLTSVESRLEGEIPLWRETFVVLNEGGGRLPGSTFMPSIEVRAEQDHQPRADNHPLPTWKSVDLSASRDPSDVDLPNSVGSTYLTRSSSRRLPNQKTAVFGSEP